MSFLSRAIPISIQSVVWSISIRWVVFSIIFLTFFSFSQKSFSQGFEIASKGNIEGDFKGWNGETIFEMSDGTFWIQAVYSYRYYYAYRPKAMVLKKDNYFFLKVDGINEILPVLPLEKIIKSQIDGNFNGFEGNSIYKLYDGSIWQQIDGIYVYIYVFSPKVLVYNFRGTWKMNVEGITVSVIRLK